MIQVTEPARMKVLELLAAQERGDLALRLAIEGRGPGGFEYKLGFVEADDHRPEDTVVEAGGFRVFIDSESAGHLKGASIEYVEGAEGAGFRVNNPNSMWTDPRAQAVQEILDTRINPAVAAHGGNVTLLDVKEDVVYIRLGGGCVGCGMVDVTLKQGIEVILKEALPEIREVVDTTDHAGGTNPYYRPSKGGGASPLA